MDLKDCHFFVNKDKAKQGVIAKPWKLLRIIEKYNVGYLAGYEFLFDNERL